MICVKVMLVLMIPYCWRMSKPSQPSSRSVACQTDDTLHTEMSQALKTLEALISQMQSQRVTPCPQPERVTRPHMGASGQASLRRGNLPFLEELKLRQANMRR